MQNQKEAQKINQFLNTVSPIIVGQARLMFQATGVKVRLHGRKTDTVFSVKSGKRQIRFSPRSLFMEIATIDKEEIPLKFDKKLLDYNFFLDKMFCSIRSRAKILFRLLIEEDVDAAIENIGRDAKQFERVRIWRFDSKPSSERQLWS